MTARGSRASFTGKGKPMKVRRLTSAIAAVALTATTLAVATPAQSAEKPLGTRSLATVLAADGHGFDSNWKDFDVVDRLVLRVLRLKPTSKLAVVTDGNRRLTAFVPTDAGFRRVGEALLGRRYTSEKALFRALWAAADRTRAGRVATVENILLVHLVAGKTLTARRLACLAPTALTTMQGGKVRVRTPHGNLVLVDRDPISPRARVVAPNINKGNRQIAHGITPMLSPQAG
jgi:uncharacterized surface protein with fasciclin (FAS1) repeats